MFQDLKDDGNIFEASKPLNEEKYIRQISTDEKLFSFKLKIKEVIIKGFSEAVEELKIYVIPNNGVYDDIIALSARYNRIYGAFQRGIIDFRTADLELTKIENTLLYIVNNLREGDLNEKMKTAANNG